MNKQTRIMALEVKALDDTTGEFTGYAAVFNNTDYADDVIVPGAFKKTLQERKSRPILWQHIPEWMIGIEAEAAEDLNGLNVKGRLNLEVQKGREAYALL
jgi:HK97 family phage prohead protease